MGVERELLVIGDRVLIRPDADKTKTSTGLYLPQGLAEKEKIQSGYIAGVGPGYIVGHADSSEPWQSGKNEPRYVPLQVRDGDYAIFMRREAVEIEYDGNEYVIVPQSGILPVVREHLPLGDL